MMQRCLAVAASWALLAVLLGSAAPAAAQPAGPPDLNWFNSAHFDFTITVAVGQGAAGQSLTLNGSGDLLIDPATQAVRMQRQLSASGQTIEIRRIGERTYVRIGANGQWRERDPADPANRSLLDMTPVQQRTIMTQIASYRQIGPETVDGMPAIHWALEIDPQRLAAYVAANPGAVAMALQSQTGAMNPQVMRDYLSRTRLVGDVWVDPATRYLRKYTFRMDLPAYQAPSQGGAARSVPPIRVEVTTTFARYNQPVTIDAPTGAIPFTPGQAPAAAPAAAPAVTMPAAPVRPVAQMPRPGALPQTLPRTGDLPGWPLALLGLALVGAGTAARRLGRRG